MNFISNKRGVMVAVDGSNYSKKAFQWYLNEIYKKEDSIILCYIPEIPPLPSFVLKQGITPPVDEWKKIIEDQKVLIDSKLNEFETECISKNLSFQILISPAKSPGEGIIAMADLHKPSYIVMGSRGLGVVRRTILGSVSNFVVHHSKVPILICPNLERNS